MSSSFGKMGSAVDLNTPHVVTASHWAYYLAAGVVLLVIYLLRSEKEPLVDVPYYKAGKTQWMFNADHLVRDSYSKFRDQIYKVRCTDGLRVMVPPKVVMELKSLPEDTLSATVAVKEALQTKYTKFSPGPHAEMMNHLVKTKLTLNLSRLNQQLREELLQFLGTEFPPCDDWTPVKVQPVALRVVARMTGRTFVGPDLCRTEQWMDTSINFAVHVFAAVIKLQFFPDWLRPLAQYLVSELGQLRRDKAIATSLLRPVIEERLRDADVPGYEKPDDYIQWLLDALPEEQRTDFEKQAELQLILAAASIHTTNNLLTECIFDLAAHPDVQEELRLEAEEVLESRTENGADGWDCKDSMARLKKMDSFIKECQRTSGNVTSFIRKVMRPITLSDGTHLPEGTSILAPLSGISHDERYYPSPEKFDAFRFYRQRQASEEDANRWQFTSIGEANVNFGAGKHACPGRFFAANQIKMVLAQLLLSYDVRLKEGQARPKCMVVMMSRTPDMKGEVLFRRRSRVE